jgi:hypothetical protein
LLVSSSRLYERDVLWSDLYKRTRRKQETRDLPCYTSALLFSCMMSTVSKWLMASSSTAIRTHNLVSGRWCVLIQWGLGWFDFRGGRLSLDGLLMTLHSSSSQLSTTELTTVSTHWQRMSSSLGVSGDGTQLQSSSSIVASPFSMASTSPSIVHGSYFTFVGLFVFENGLPSCR